MRYAYWRAVAFLCLALPWIQPYQHGQAVAARVTTDVAVAASQTRSAAVAATRVDWAAIVLAVLAAGILLRLLWLAARAHQAAAIASSRARRSAGTPSMPISSPSFGTRADIRYARDLQQPVTFGICAGRSCCSPTVMRNQPPDIQRAVIGHELLHVKRRDWAWLIVEEIAVCLFWFHPASWWVASQIQCAREEVVDELAILLTGRRKTYVEALLAFADATSVVPTAAFARRRHLLRRIALVSKEDVMSSRRIVATCAAMALIVGLGSWYSVSAFPLRVADQAASGHHDIRWRRAHSNCKAHTVTPENPIPRRVHYEEPVLPDSVASVHGAVGLKVTLDDVGRIAEARLVEVSVNGRGVRYEHVWSRRKWIPLARFAQCQRAQCAIRLRLSDG